ncbi:unnamed protein product, partial [Darwinula stevensoni]
MSGPKRGSSRILSAGSSPGPAAEAAAFAARIHVLERLLTERDDAIAELRGRLDQYRAVLRSVAEQTSENFVNVSKKLESVQTELLGLGCNGMMLLGSAGTSAFESVWDSKAKRVAVSGEPPRLDPGLSLHEFLRTHPLVKVPKEQRSKELIKTAILNNDFMKNLEGGQIGEIVDCMYPVESPKGALLIREGDIGNKVYVME